MPVNISTSLHYEASLPCDVLLQIEADEDEGQRCISQELKLPNGVLSRQIEGEDGVGTRRWMTVPGDFVCTYFASFEVSRVVHAVETLCAGLVSNTPAEATKYLLPSRYCHPEAFLDVLSGSFAGLSGGAMVLAMSDWIRTHITYDIFASQGGTTATDSFKARAGVCRDFAHILIAMARAAGIPARYASVYAPGVEPQDFHAVVEVYLSGAWHLIDPTGMADPKDMVRIGVGRDAADVSFLTSYGFLVLNSQSVEVSRVS